MAGVDWNLIARFIVSVIILLIAAWLIIDPSTMNDEAIAISLITVVAGFWLHALPGNGQRT